MLLFYPTTVNVQLNVPDAYCRVAVKSSKVSSRNYETGVTKPNCWCGFVPWAPDVLVSVAGQSPDELGGSASWGISTSGSAGVG